MKRRTHTTSDSLDLLLDAVTNAFGGILFLAILIVLLVNRQSGRTQPAPTLSSAASIARESRANDLQSQIELLKSTIHEQEKTLNDLTANDASFEKVIELQHSVSELEVLKEEFFRKNHALSEEAEDLTQEEKQLQLEILANEKQRASLEEELAKLKLPQIRTAKTPRLKRTSKQEFPFILRYGKLYVPYLVDSDTAARSFNRDDFILVDDGINVTRITPKPYRGIPLNDAVEIADKLKKMLEDLDERQFYIAIAAWSDSFVEFNQLRNTIVLLGFEYRIVPVEVGGFIQEGAVDEAMIQ